MEWLGIGDADKELQGQELQPIELPASDGNGTL
jgi:hypothetical protein